MAHSPQMTEETTLAVPVYVRALRKRKMLSQERLASLAGLSTATVSNLETGRNGFTDKTIAALANALQCRPADLFLPPEMNEKVKGEAGIKALLLQIDGLPESAIIPILRLISGYLEDAE